MNLPFGDMPAADEGTEAGSTGDTAGEQTSHVTTRETVLRDAMCDAAELAVRPPTSHLLHSTWPRLRLALAIARATAASRTSDWQAVLQYARTAAELAGGLYGQGSLPELNARHAESVALCGLKRCVLGCSQVNRVECFAKNGRTDPCTCVEFDTWRKSGTTRRRSAPPSCTSSPMPAATGILHVPASNEHVHMLWHRHHANMD